MYPFFRFAKTLTTSTLAYKNGDTLALDDTSIIEFYAHLGDIDNYLEVNNGRILTLYDMGRIDFAVRTGLGAKLLKHHWGLVVAGSTIQYRKRIRAFNKISMHTRLKGFDARWFYMEQSMFVKNKLCSHVLLRTGITNLKTGKVIDSDMVMTSLGYKNVHMPLEGWAADWAKADSARVVDMQALPKLPNTKGIDGV